MKSRSALVALGVTILVGLLLAAISLAHHLGFSTVERLMRDPAATTGASLSLGAASHLGILASAVAAGICLFTWAVLRRGYEAADPILFLGWAGVLTGVLCLDDLYMVHERIAPRYLGVSEGVVYAAYAAAGISLLVRFRVTVLRGEAVLLVGAGAALATAVLLDLLPTRGLLFPGASGDVLAEDGAKLLGLFLWATYLIRIAGSTIRNARRSTAAPPATAVPRSD